MHRENHNSLVTPSPACAVTVRDANLSAYASMTGRNLRLRCVFPKLGARFCDLATALTGLDQYLSKPEQSVNYGELPEVTVRLPP